MFAPKRQSTKHFGPCTIKAAFTDCPIADRQRFKNSCCIMPTSVGIPVHEGDKLQAVLALVNRSFKNCTILVDDYIQRYTLAIKENHTPESLTNTVLALGDDWLQRNEPLYSQLTIPYALVRWRDWLDQPNFNYWYELIVNQLKENSLFQEAMRTAAVEFLIRYQKRQVLSKKDYERAYILCWQYLKEECAVMCLWAESGFDFELYPSGRNVSMKATYKYCIQPKFNNLLTSVSIHFKKSGKKTFLSPTPSSTTSSLTTVIDS